MAREWLLVALLGLLGASVAVHTAQAFHVSQLRAQAAQLAAQCLGERTPWAGRR